jgi:hypothetical protein
VDTFDFEKVYGSLAQIVLDLFNTAKQSAVGFNRAHIDEPWERSPPSRAHVG